MEGTVNSDGINVMGKIILDVDGKCSLGVIGAGDNVTNQSVAEGTTGAALDVIRIFVDMLSGRTDMEAFHDQMMAISPEMGRFAEHFASNCAAAINALSNAAAGST